MQTNPAIAQYKPVFGAIH